MPLPLDFVASFSVANGVGVGRSDAQTIVVLDGLHDVVLQGAPVAVAAQSLRRLPAPSPAAVDGYEKQA